MNQYEMREILKTAAKIAKIESQPLEHKREASQEFFDRLVNCPDLVAVEISCLLSGNYGFGYQDIANSFFNRSKRFKIHANLIKLIGIAVYRCPARQARQAYNILSIRQKNDINKLIDKEVQHHKSKQKTPQQKENKNDERIFKSA